MLHNFVTGKPMADDEKELKDQRVVTMMSPSELEAIDDWMFKNRIRSRGEAIRRLCHIGMIMDEAKLMKRAMHAISHYVKEIDKLAGSASGKSLDEDVKALCWSIFKAESQSVGFKTDKDIKDAIAMVDILETDYKNAALNSPHLQDKKAT
jgi:hypothetical protein